MQGGMMPHQGDMGDSFQGCPGKAKIGTSTSCVLLSTAAHLDVLYVTHKTFKDHILLSICWNKKSKASLRSPLDVHYLYIFCYEGPLTPSWTRTGLRSFDCQPRGKPLVHLGRHGPFRLTVVSQVCFFLFCFQTKHVLYHAVVAPFPWNHWLSYGKEFF